jgi:tetratricopeptide (TPR) repeat protein
VEALLHAVLNNYPAAGTSYEAALELEPNSSPLHYWHGMFLMRSSDDTEAALSEFEKADKIDPASHQAAMTARRCIRFLDSRPDYKVRAQDVYDWIANL